MSEPSRIVNSRRLLPFPNSSAAYSRPSSSRPASRQNSRHIGNIDSSSTLASDSMGQFSSLLVGPRLLTHKEVTDYLHQDPKFLDDFVQKEENVDEARFEKWTGQRKMYSNSQHSEGGALDTSPQSRYATDDVISLQKTLVAAIKNNQDFAPILYEMAVLIGKGISADGSKLYRLCNGGQELSVYVPNTHVASKYQLIMYGPVEQGTTIAAYAAHSSTAVYLEDIMADDRFPMGVGRTEDGSLSQSVICVPVTLPSGDIIGVLQFTRDWQKPPFSRTNYQMVLALVSWMGCTVLTVQDNHSLRKQLNIEDNLMDISRGMFDDITELDVVSEKTMGYAKDLVHAERSALFLLNPSRAELYSNLFDDGVDDDGKTQFRRSDTIRFPVSKGIAGYVARTKEIVNIKDAYSDERFNREIDKQTGFTTRNILCMPIVSKEAVVGVIQMINKKNGDYFTISDADSFKRFSGFCALALHYSKMYEEMKYKSTQLTVAMEQLSYHITCQEKDLLVSQVDLQEGYTPILEAKDLPPDLDSFYFYPLADKVIEKLPHYFIHMICSLVGPDYFDFDHLWRFVLTVRKNYRDVPYHNWIHGFNVAHCMYVMLKEIKGRGLMDKLTMRALMIACLCHDIDHRGYNNAFMTKLEDPLSQLYSTSVMEKHHFNHTITILQHNDHNIFEHLSADDYKKTLEIIQRAIFATDLVLFFPIQKQMAQMLLTTESLDFSDANIMEMAESIMMTGCDLVAVCKGFPTQVLTLKCIYEEFYQQGDKEKIAGITPIQMMDRDFAHRQPQDQCGFINFVCRPCYATLADMFPEFSPLLSGCMDNLEQWQRSLAGKSTVVWEPSKSVAEPDDSTEKKPDVPLAKLM